MSDPLPPHSIEAEQAVLGAILIQPDIIATLPEQLTPDAFFHGPHGTIFAAMRALFQAKRVPDYTTLVDLLQARGKLDEVGGLAAISSLLSSVVTAVYVGEYVDIVLRDARKRSLINAATDLVQLGYRATEAEPDYDAVLTTVRSKIAAFDAHASATGGIAEHVDSLEEQTLRRWSGDLEDDVVPTGIPSVDALASGGMRAGELWVLAARPSMGKTALMLHMARRCRSLVCSLEMTAQAVTNRLISTEAGVPYDLAMRRMGDLTARNRWLEAAAMIRSLPMTIVDATSTTSRIEALAHRLKADQGLDAIFIDHLDHLSDRIRTDSPYERASELIMRCKQLAMATGVPVLVLSQLNRAAEERPTCLPQLSDIRSSGRIEEFADVVGLMFRRRYYVERGRLDATTEDYVSLTSNQERVQVDIAKNRNGQIGLALMGWEPKAMRFHEFVAA